MLTVDLRLPDFEVRKIVREKCAKFGTVKQIRIVGDEKPRQSLQCCRQAPPLGRIARTHHHKVSGRQPARGRHPIRRAVVGHHDHWKVRIEALLVLE